MKRVFLAGLLLSVGLAAAYGYGVTRREAHYRDLLAEGDAAVAAGDLTAALEAFGRAIFVMPDSMAAYLKRGETYTRREEFEAAQRDLRRAAELDPAARAARRCQLRHRALRAGRRPLRGIPRARRQLPPVVL